MHSTIQLYHFFILFVKAKTTKSKIVYKKIATLKKSDYFHFYYSAFSSAFSSATTSASTSFSM